MCKTRWRPVTIAFSKTQLPLVLENVSALTVYHCVQQAGQTLPSIYRAGQDDIQDPSDALDFNCDLMDAGRRHPSYLSQVHADPRP